MVSNVLDCYPHERHSIRCLYRVSGAYSLVEEIKWVCVCVSVLLYTSSALCKQKSTVDCLLCSLPFLSLLANLQHFSKRLSRDHTGLASLDIFTTSVCFFSRSVLSSAGDGEGRRVSVKSFPEAQSSHQERPKALLFYLSSITSIGTAHLGWQ